MIVIQNIFIAKKKAFIVEKMTLDKAYCREIIFNFGFLLILASKSAWLGYDKLSRVDEWLTSVLFKLRHDVSRG